MAIPGPTGPTGGSYNNFPTNNPQGMDIDKMLSTPEGRKQLAEMLEEMQKKKSGDTGGCGGGGGGGGASSIQDIIDKLLKGEALNPEEIKRLKEFMHKGKDGDSTNNPNSVTNNPAPPGDSKV